MAINQSMFNEQYNKIFDLMIAGDSDKAAQLFSECVQELASTRNIVRAIIKENENDSKGPTTI